MNAESGEGAGREVEVVQASQVFEWEARRGAGSHVRADAREMSSRHRRLDVDVRPNIQA
jgi:hypothetical protein